MQHIWSILCQNSTIDGDTNSLSIFNCFEQLNVDIDKSKMPQDKKVVLPIGFDLVSLWIDDNTTKERPFKTT